jgi:uncharacterized membrane protein YsdA (DUF1294 family)
LKQEYEIILIYFLSINIIGAIINIIDKIKAKHHRWRISERVLWLVAIFGGATLSYITMKIIRHKTQHKQFMIGFPILSIIQIVGLVAIFVIR